MRASVLACLRFVRHLHCGCHLSPGVILPSADMLDTIEPVEVCNREMGSNYIHGVQKPPCVAFQHVLLRCSPFPFSRRPFRKGNYKMESTPKMRTRNTMDGICLVDAGSSWRLWLVQRQVNALGMFGLILASLLCVVKVLCFDKRLPRMPCPLSAGLIRAF